MEYGGQLTILNEAPLVSKQLFRDKPLSDDFIRIISTNGDW
jgi:hypothetical protein